MTAPELGPGVAVEVIRGMAKGKRGVVVTKWGRCFGTIPMWRVRFDDIGRDRVLRADFLQPVEAS